MTDSNNNNISHNQMYYNDVNNVKLSSSSNNIIEHNYIDYSWFGSSLLLESSSNNIIRFNNISSLVDSMGYGVELTSGSIDNNISYNNLIGDGYKFFNNQPDNILVEDNWWETSNESYIQGNITDYYDNNSLGVVYYDPWLCAPYPSTEITSCRIVTRGINLIVGWNSLSIPVMLDNMSVSAIFEGVDYSKVFTYGSSWAGLGPDDIIEPKQGLWVEVLSPGILQIPGGETEPTLDLHEGWNFVGCQCLNETPLSEVLEGYDYERVLMYNASDGMWKSYNKYRPFNDLNSMIPGYGYWVKINAQPDEWVRYRHSLNGDGVNPYPGPKNANLLWSYQTNGRIYTTPAVSNGIVYIGNDAGTFYALNLTDGTQIWNVSLGAQIRASAAVEKGIVYIGQNNGTFFALDASDGHQIWNHTNGGVYASSALVYNDVVYFGSLGSKVWALDALTGEDVWNFTTVEMEVHSSPSIVNNVLYIGAYDNKTYALNALTGEQIWNFTTIGYVYTTPAVVNNRVYFGTYGGMFYAVNAADGSLIWNLPIGGSLIYSSPAVYGNMVYVGGGSDNTFYSLNASNGNQIWNYTASSSFGTSSPAYSDGVVYIGNNNHKIYAFNATNGSILWSFDAGGSGNFYGSPIVVDGMVIAGSYNKKVYALKD